MSNTEVRKWGEAMSTLNARGPAGGEVVTTEEQVAALKALLRLSRLSASIHGRENSCAGCQELVKRIDAALPEAPDAP